MKGKIIIAGLMLSISLPGLAEQNQAARVDAEGYRKLLDQAFTLRQKRILNLNDFLRMARENNVVLLDTRSESAYKRLHLKGAVHLSFSAFTDASLAKVIPDKNTKILIYCNNNFLNNKPPIMTKRVEVALNHQTFANLYAYGYKNVYEMGSLVDIKDQRFELAGSDAEKFKAAK